MVARNSHPTSFIRANIELHVCTWNFTRERVVHIRM